MTGVQLDRIYQEAREDRNFYLGNLFGLICIVVSFWLHPKSDIEEILVYLGWFGYVAYQSLMKTLSRILQETRRED